MLKFATGDYGMALITKLVTLYTDVFVGTVRGSISFHFYLHGGKRGRLSVASLIPRTFDQEIYFVK